MYGCVVATILISVVVGRNVQPYSFVVVEHEDSEDGFVPIERVVQERSGGHVEAWLTPHRALIRLPDATSEALRLPTHPWAAVVDPEAVASCLDRDGCVVTAHHSENYYEGRRLPVSTGTFRLHRGSQTSRLMGWSAGAASERRLASIHSTLEDFATRSSVLWFQMQTPVQYRTRGTASVFRRTQRARSDWEGRDECVTVIDTGLDTEHCHFVDPNHDVPYYRLVGGGSSLQIRVPAQHSKIDAYVHVSDARPNRLARQDSRETHGTHVAASAVGDPRECGETEAADFGGIAPKARLLFVDIGDHVDHKSMHVPNDMHDILATSYNAGSRILSISWGTDDNSYTDLCHQLDSFVRSHDDYVVVVAAGNDGRRGSHTVGSPATCKNVIAVGASANSYDAFDWLERHPDAWGDTKDRPQNTRAEWAQWTNHALPFSARGPTQDGRAKPDCVAPGAPIVSASPRGTRALEAKFGTSQAAPLVAAHVANLREWLRTTQTVAHPSSALIRAIVAATATGSTAAPNDDDGFGRCSVRVEDDITDGRTMWVRDDIPISPMKSVDLCLRPSSWNGPVNIAVAWTDLPSAPVHHDGSLLMHDLDLVVDYADFQFQGNDKLDFVNNVERVTIAHREGAPQPLRIHINARHLVASQTFALVVSGNASFQNVPCDAKHTFDATCVPADKFGVGVLGEDGVCGFAHCLPHYAMLDGRCTERRLATTCPRTDGLGLLINQHCAPSLCAPSFRMGADHQCRCTRDQRCHADSPPSHRRLCVDGVLGPCIHTAVHDDFEVVSWTGLMLYCIVLSLVGTSFLYCMWRCKRRHKVVTSTSRRRSMFPILTSQHDLQTSERIV